MANWLICTITGVGFLAGYFISEHFRPKVVEIQRDTTFLTRTIEVPVERIVIRHAPAVIHTITMTVHDTVQIQSYASLDTGVVNSEGSLDTVKAEYYFPPINEFRNVYVGIAPRHPVILEKTVFVEKTVEKSQFLGGYPEKLLYFVAGYGVATVVSNNAK